MKISVRTLFLFITFSIFCSAYSSNAQVNEMIIEIEDFRNKEFPSFIPDKHRYKDIEVFRSTATTESSYFFFAYGKKDGEITQNGFMALELKDNFDRAAYEWKSDTLARVRLFNSETGKDFFVEMEGGWLTGESFSLRVVD